jgi:glycosyltransferase involved in cell wall biosynthesis
VGDDAAMAAAAPSVAGIRQAGGGMMASRRRARRRLLTIGHSYCVELNRRLPQEIARSDGWDVTAVAPARFRGDFGWHVTETNPGEPCRVVAVPVHFGRRVHTMLYGRALAKLLQEPWDVVHCWEEPYVASAAQVAGATALRVPLVFATFQNIVKRYPPPFNWIERSAMRRADGLIAFGQTSREVLDARGWPQPVRTIPPGVDIERFRPDAEQRERTRGRYGWTGDTPVVGFVGRFVPEKGVALLLQTLDRLKTPWRALFIGSGPLESDIRRWSRPRADHVRVETGVGHDEVPVYLNALDVLCAPSVTTGAWREQFGRMLIEAFACGVPVVASDSGEIPHVVKDAGVVAAERDRDAWLNAVERLLLDPARRADLSRRGRERAVATYSWRVVARQHLDFFNELTR